MPRRNKLAFALFVFLLPLMALSQKKPGVRPHSITPVRGSMVNSGMTAGKAVYMKTCVSCHQRDGGGVPNMNPSLINAFYVRGDKDKLIGIILRGLAHQEIEGENYHNVMPPFTALSDNDIANVLTYVRKSFGNKYAAITARDVKAVREKK